MATPEHICREAAIVSLLLLAAYEYPCLLPGPADACHYADPMLPGMFPVGVTRVTLIDGERRDRAGEPRRLETEIWYPALPEAREAPRDAIDLAAEAPEDLAEQLAGLVVLSNRKVPWHRC